MKKVFLSLAVVALLAACGAEKAGTDAAKPNDSTATQVDTTLKVEAPVVEAPVDTIAPVAPVDTNVVAEDTSKVEG